MIVVKDEDAVDKSLGEERCCFCRDLTWFVYWEADVAVCQECARTANPEDVPNKQTWMRREEIAENRPASAPIVSNGDFSVRNQLGYDSPCICIHLPYGGDVIISSSDAKDLCGKIGFYANLVEEITERMKKNYRENEEQVIIISPECQ